MRKILAAAVMALAAACGGSGEKTAATADEPQADADIVIVGLDDLAERFVKLGLNLGRYDKNYVDAYSGPAEWAAEAEKDAATLDDLEQEALRILEGLQALAGNGASPRETGLKRNVDAALARIRMSKGERYSFNEEARLIYGFVPPDYDVAEFDAALAEIAALVPGEGDIAARVDAYVNSLAIPGDKLQPVMDAAIAECRRRTLAHYDLPDGETFTMKTVTGKPWSGYNWYQGDFESVIEINTDFPVTIDRAVALGCHEGYPGHHVWNVIVERDLKGANGWVEFSITPLFSPNAIVAEGSANFGVDLAFPGDEKTAFERDVLFPLAGLDPAEAERLAMLNGSKKKLAHAQNMIARDYLDGRIDRDAAIEMLRKYGLNSRERAKQRADFIDTYRAYVINYNLGQDLVRAYVEAREKEGVDGWSAFEEILKSPDGAGLLATQ
ncbi:MAG TPA: hypothetical protein PKH09_10535 [Parvularculaceae bacterium]|nr:hypothetical protein [Parvularculaceae bacterium]